MVSGNPSLRHLAIHCIADVHAVGKAVEAAHTFGASLTPQTESRLAIIAEELVSNLMDHAEMPVGAAIELVITLDTGLVRLTLTDNGVPFDPRTSLLAPIPARGGGAGLALLQAWAVIESYEQVGSRNVLTLSLATD